MAQFQAIKPPKPIEITKFLGLNESVGDTEIALGEAVRQENFRITKNYKPKKRPGHHTFVDCVSFGQIRSAWYGKIGYKRVLLFIFKGVLYEYNLNVDTPATKLSDLMGSAWNDSLSWNDYQDWDEQEGAAVKSIGPVSGNVFSFLWFGGKVIIKTDGSDIFYTYDGTALSVFTPYTPTITVGTPPTGGGTLFEEINILNRSKTQSFTADGTATLYQLAEKNISNVVVTINGVATTAFTISAVNGTVTFTTAPVNKDVVLITYQGDLGYNPSAIMMNPHMIDFGVGNDTNLFLFGSASEKNVFRYSMVGKPFYFPANAFVRVNTDLFSITDMVSQYQSLIVFKEDSTYIVRPEPNSLYSSNTGLNPYNFPYFDLNESVGNIAPKMVQLVENTPISLYGSSFWKWESATGVEDERNAKIISDRIKLSLDNVDLSQAVTHDYQDQKELWVSVGGKVYVWNYGNDTMYIFTNIRAKQFLNIDGNVYYVDGKKIERFDESFKADKAPLGDKIPCKLYTGFSDFGSLEYRKMMRDEWLAISPASKTSCDISFLTDRVQDGEAKIETVQYNLLDFNNIDFNKFSFLGNVNPQPNRLKLKVKKFTYIQVLLENNTNNEDLTVLKLLMQAQVQGLSR